MPFGDRTGPEGFGARTGRSLGYCNGYNQPGYAERMQGRGFRKGFGRGLRYSQRFFDNSPQEQQPTNWRYEKEPVKNDVSVLEDYAKSLEESLKELKKKIEEFKK